MLELIVKVERTDKRLLRKIVIAKEKTSFIASKKFTSPEQGTKN